MGPSVIGPFKPYAVSSSASPGWRQPLRQPLRQRQQHRGPKHGARQHPRVREALAGLGDQPDRLVRREPPDLGQSLSRHVLHHDERASVLGLAGVVDVDDVRVRETRRQPCLAQEAIAKGRVAGEALRENLDRDRPAELVVAGEEDGRHAAMPERALESVAAAAEVGGIHAADFYRRVQVFRAAGVLRMQIRPLPSSERTSR